MQESALVLANGHFDTIFAKTTHGLVRGPSRYPIQGVVDVQFAGKDAGTVLDGRPRQIPIFASVEHALAELETLPTHCIVGVATSGGVLPDDLYADLVFAARSGLHLVNGLHRLLSEEAELVELTQSRGTQILDIRKPKPAKELHFWTGAVHEVRAPRVAVLGIDCALGKRTTCMLLREACRAAGIHAEMIYTGQTGWLHGLTHGFIFDSTLNDFVSGELEQAILACDRDLSPDVMLLEGQSALRNPSGPAGAELIISGAASGVILQHAPGRTHFIDLEERGLRIPTLEEEIQLIRLLGAEVWAVCIHEEGLAEPDVWAAKEALAERLGVPVVVPLREGVGALVDVLKKQL